MNSAGGAVYCIEHGHPTMADCLFEGNSASEGGAVHLDGDGEATVIGCTFLANEATDIGRGGAVYNSSNCTGNLDGCRFLGNTANGWGGALYAKGAPTVVSCLFSGNSAVRGAGIYAEIYALPVVVNCTFSNNVAAEEGGAFCSIVGTTRFSNCILWGNAPQEIRSDTGGLQIDHSDVQGLGLSSQGNIDANPRFQDPLGADAIAGVSEQVKKQKLQDIFFATAYYDKLVREKKDVAYYGDAVSATDAGKVLIRWKTERDKYRVVFGDLTAKDVTADELKTLEGR